MKPIYFTLYFCFLAGGSIFIYIPYFTDTQILPKWIYTLLATAIGIIALGICYLSNAKVSINQKQLFYIIESLCFLQAIWSICQWSKLMITASYPISGAAGTFDNPAGLSACLSLSIPFILYFLYQPNKYKSIHIGILTIVIVALLLTESRTGWLSTFVCLAVYGWKISKPHFMQRKKIFCFSIATLLLVSCCIGGYIYKKDSADGRILIWRCTWNMVKEKPLLGYGINGFEANYMDFQARYFVIHPQSKYSLLADNVKHPFNEFLSVAVHFGLTGILVLLAIAFFLIWCYRQEQTMEKFICLLSLVGLSVFSFFSYPFTYPFTWLIVLLDVYVLTLTSIRELISIINQRFKCLFVILMISFSFFISYKLTIRIYNEIEWKQATSLSLNGDSEQAFKKYRLLVKSLHNNPYFLYNYAVELYIAKHYYESLRIAKLCKTYWSDYDLELLAAMAYEQNGKIDQAEMNYKKASYMCPNRFIPAYRLALLFKDKGEIKKAYLQAHQIINKPIKIPSPTINSIKREMKKLLTTINYEKRK